MVRRQYSNIAVETTITSGVDADDTTITVASASGWPAAPFTAVLEEGTPSEEIILVGNKAGNVFSSITRAFGGTSGAVHSGGAAIKHVGTAGDLDLIWEHAHDGVDDSAQVNHGDLIGVGIDDHHAEAHTIGSHSDTNVTGAALTALADGSDADALHSHPAVAAEVDALQAADTAHFGGTDIADHPEATISTRGFLSAADKTKLTALDVVDDEGSSNPTITGSGTNPTVAYTSRGMTWTRVAGLLIGSGFIHISTISGGSGEALLSIPLEPNLIGLWDLAVAGDSQILGAGSFRDSSASASSRTFHLEYASDTPVRARMLVANPSAKAVAIAVSALGSSDTISWTMFYRV